jgi:murein DD-endopeptidase MepM/ murein hydrolase activator NlpD
VRLKKLTVFLIPDGRRAVKQFTVPRFLPILMIPTCVVSVILLAWLFHDYQTVKARVPRLVRLQRENEQQKTQLLHLNERIQQAMAKIEGLEEFDLRLRTMVNLETDDEAAGEGVGGSDSSLSEPEPVVSRTNRDLTRSMHRSLDRIEHEIALREETRVELQKFLKNQVLLLASTPSIWPAKGWMSSRFGNRLSPFTGEREFHKGIDIAARVGSPVVAPGDAIVSRLDWESGYGRTLTLRHGYGVVTRYGHLKKILVKKGQYVKRGETIALMGNSGRSTGPHLHYEVYLNSVPVNPLKYILNKPPS